MLAGEDGNEEDNINVKQGQKAISLKKDHVFQSEWKWIIAYDADKEITTCM